LADEEGARDPEAEEAMEFLNELYEEEFDEAVFELVSEADEFYQDRFESEYGDPLVQKMQAARMLEQHFAPLVAEAEMFLDTMAQELGQHNPSSLDEAAIESLIDRYEPQNNLSPSFEDFLGGLKNKLKGAINKAASLAKQGIKLAGQLGLKPILEKLKQLIKPLVKRVVQYGINKLPPALRPVADQFAKRFLNQEFEEETTSSEEATPDVSGIQREFDGQIANLLFTREAVEQELAIAEYVKEAQKPIAHDLLSELDRARAQFVKQLGELREGEDPTPLVQNFIPAILPALKLGISLAGRSRIVIFLAKYLAKLIIKFIGPQFYYLEIPEARPQVVPVAGGAPKPRRIRQVHIRFNFPCDLIQVNLFLSETVAQTIAVKLRQKASIGTVMPHLSAIYEPRLKKIMTEKHHSHMKTIHGKVPPKGSRGRILSRLPQTVREWFIKNMIEWLGKNLTTYLQQKSPDFITATENPADGVTLKIVFTNPPGLSHLRKILRGESVNIQEIQAKGGMPDANIQVIPGFNRG
jgi:hypothetical protein